MREYAGHCRSCEKDKYCENGFFNGVILKKTAKRYVSIVRRKRKTKRMVQE